MQPNNYRPVSLTSIICKLLEKIVQQAVMEHLIDNGLINDNQHGFVPGRSCITQLFVVLDHWTDILDDHGALDAIYLDFAKAFDIVPHERLLLKVENHGIKGNALKWIRDFLSNCQQRVVIIGTHSAWAPVTSGIPQGSVLGPLLFVIFVNDMPDVVKSFLYMFADDAKLFTRVNATDGISQLQDDFNALSNWADTWQLTSNATKCKAMHLGNKNPKTTYSLTTSAGVSQLEPTQAEKDLRVMVDDQLTFTCHVEAAVNKANKILGLIRISCSHLDQTSLRHLYTALVRPHLEYGNVAWSPRYLKDSRLLENVQHRATKLVPELRNLPYEERLRMLGLPSLFYRRARGDMIEVYKFLHKVYEMPHTLLERAAEGPTRGTVSNWTRSTAA